LQVAVVVERALRKALRLEETTVEWNIGRCTKTRKWNDIQLTVT
jgi:hypothetical protein